MSMDLLSNDDMGNANNNALAKKTKQAVSLQGTVSIGDEEMGYVITVGKYGVLPAEHAALLDRARRFHNEVGDGSITCEDDNIKRNSEVKILNGIGKKLDECMEIDSKPAIDLLTTITRAYTDVRKPNSEKKAIVKSTILSWANVVQDEIDIKNTEIARIAAEQQVILDEQKEARILEQQKRQEEAEKERKTKVEERQKAEKIRIDKERELQRIQNDIDAKQLEEERIEKERLERVEKERIEKEERKKAETAKRERLEREKIELEERERIEKEEREKAELEGTVDNEDAKRIEEELRLERERIEKEKAEFEEKERLEREEREEKEKVEREERERSEIVERERIEREKVELEQQKNVVNDAIVNSEDELNRKRNEAIAASANVLNIKGELINIESSGLIAVPKYIKRSTTSKGVNIAKYDEWDLEDFELVPDKWTDLVRTLNEERINKAFKDDPTLEILGIRRWKKRIVRAESLCPRSITG